MDRPFFSCCRGSSMIRPPKRSDTAYTLIELLVVLVIVGILAAVGVMMIGDRKGNAVRGVMDEIEGVLSAAQRNTMATGADVTIQASGKWTDGTLRIDGRRTTPGTDPTDPTNRLGPLSEVFASHYLDRRRDHLSAGVDTGAGYATALGAAKELVKVPPCDTEPFKTALGNNLCTGADTTVTVNGTNKRFTTGFCIIVTGLQGAGSVAADGPVGVIVVPASMSSVFKFYKREGETQWRRL